MLVYTGDFFDNGWKPHRCSPELINHAVRILPKGFGIPGQHDLPYHRHEDVKKSAYWTLVLSGVVDPLPPDCPVAVNDRLTLHGFPWGTEVESFDKRWNDYHKEGQPLRGVNLAVLHAYCWEKGHTYPGAPQECQVDEWRERLAGYTCAVFGDNHKGFLSSGRGIDILNGGTFIRRRSDEVEYQPVLGLVYEDGTIGTAKLDTSGDEWCDDLGAAALLETDLDKDAAPSEVDVRKLLGVLGQLGEVAVSFGDAIKQFLDTNVVPPEVQQLILEGLAQQGKGGD